MTTPKDKKASKKAGKHNAGKSNEEKSDSRSHNENPAEPTENTEETLPPVDDRYLRLQADFDNYRKRVLREKDDLYRRANENIMEELLPVLDHLELALNSAGDAHEHDPVVEGFQLVADQMINVLGKFGLSRIETDGQEFDPNIHEAILHMPSEAAGENQIVSQTRGGYKLGEKLLRASQVVVSSGAAEAE